MESWLADALIDALARPNGTTIDDLVRATGWRDASTAKSGLYWDVQQKGYGIGTETSDDGSLRYHLVPPSGVKSVPAHVEPAQMRAAANTALKSKK